jgi:hypothetical protein
MTDRITKALLAVTALGLWANAAAPLIKPTPAYAVEQELRDDLRFFGERLNKIVDTLGLLAEGRCANKKLC